MSSYEDRMRRLFDEAFESFFRQGQVARHFHDENRDFLRNVYLMGWDARAWAEEVWVLEAINP